MNHLVFLAFASTGLGAAAFSIDDLRDETIQYLRPSGKGHVPEARFTVRQEKSGWTIESVTGRPEAQMAVSARYDAQDRLMSAEATLSRKAEKTTVAVEVAEGKAKVGRQEFDVPPGTIVTSAPDWTDIFLLCCKFERKNGGKQTFAGLWIHPVQPAQLLKFTIEREGQDEVKHDNKRIELARFRIHIRGPNPYTAWADDKGTLVKLMPGGVVREGFEESTKELGAKSKK